MGPARYWDDPDADLERTVDLPVPPTVRAEFEPTPREFAILNEVIDAIRMVGVLLVVGGLLALFGTKATLGAMVRPAAMITGLVTLPGALYVVASAGLTARRYWAWVMSMAITAVLMLTLFGLGVFLIGGMEEPAEALVLVPLAMLFAMPSLLLFYMLRARPVIRDAELLVGAGFDVLPANDDAAEDAPPPRAVLPVDSDAEVSTSPSPAPPAPSPPPPPPRS